MMKLIHGERCSGKTTSLLDEVYTYLTENPKADAIILTPTYSMAEVMAERVCDHEKLTNLFGQISIMPIYSYIRQKRIYDSNIGEYGVFIDQLDHILNDLVSKMIVATTMDTPEVVEELKYKEKKK